MIACFTISLSKIVLFGNTPVQDWQRVNKVSLFVVMSLVILAYMEISFPFCRIDAQIFYAYPGNIDGN